MINSESKLPLFPVVPPPQVKQYECVSLEAVYDDKVGTYVYSFIPPDRNKNVYMVVSESVNSKMHIARVGECVFHDHVNEQISLAPYTLAGVIF